MSEGRGRLRARVVATTLLAVLTGMLAGGAFNAALGDRGADTPALALLGGALALVLAVAAQRWRRARAARGD